MWINKFGILAINQKSPKDITEGILFNDLSNCDWMENIEYFQRNSEAWHLRNIKWHRHKLSSWINFLILPFTLTHCLQYCLQQSKHVFRYHQTNLSCWVQTQVGFSAFYRVSAANSAEYLEQGKTFLLLFVFVITGMFYVIVLSC